VIGSRAMAATTTIIVIIISHCPPRLFVALFADNDSRVRRTDCFIFVSHFTHARTLLLLLLLLLLKKQGYRRATYDA
jgi:hypothetical protein